MFRGKRVDLLLRISSHALILCGLLTVIPTDEIPVPIWLLALSAHPMSIFMKPKEGGGISNLVIILALAYSTFLYVFLNTPLLIVLTQFLILIQALKLFHLDRAKDYFQLAGLSLLMMLASAGLTSQFYYLLLFIAFILIGIWFLMLLHLKSDLERHPHMSPPPRHLTSFPLFMGVSGIAFFSLFLTFVIFFMLPRLSLSVTGKGTWGDNSTGFSEVVDLGDIGPVKLDERVVMRVELPDFNQPPSYALYWRGMSFSQWNGHVWEREVTVTKIEKAKKEWLTLYKDKDRGKTIFQCIMLEPIGTDLLFCIHPPLKVRGDFSFLNVDGGGGMHMPSPPFRKCYYEVLSDLQPYDGKYDNLQGEDTTAYLQIPEGHEYIITLVNEIVKRGRSHLEKINRVISYLRNNCTYSLNPKRDETHPPLEDFLLYSREGYCEHFASAAALLLRGTGVPTRLVSGFSQGEWNPLGKYFMVRQRDAHVWIEAYLPDKGWLSFDPTPAGEQKDRPFFLSTIYRYFDLLKLRWNRYIVHYTHEDQLRLLFVFRRNLGGFSLFPHTHTWQKIKTNRYTSKRPYLIVVTAFVAFVGILFGFWGFKRMRGSIGITSSSKPLHEISFYLSILRALSRKRIIKQVGETPIEFSQRVGHIQSDLYPSLVRITNLYYRIRFGQILLTPQEHEEIGKIIRDLKKMISLLSPMRKGS